MEIEKINIDTIFNKVAIATFPLIVEHCNFIRWCFLEILNTFDSFEGSDLRAFLYTWNGSCLFWRCPLWPSGDIMEDAKAWVISIACQKPCEFGYVAELWTLAILHRHIKKFADDVRFLRLKTVTAKVPETDGYQTL